MQLLDAIFNHRISLAHDALFYYGIGIFRAWEKMQVHMREN